MFGQAHEFLDLGDAGEGGGFVFGELEFVFVEVLEHLLEGDGVVSHEVQHILLGGAFVGFGFGDLVAELGGAFERGFVSVEYAAVGTEIDEVNCGGEVAGQGRGWC